jgi:hypothetical protein
MMKSPTENDYQTYDPNYKNGPWDESLLSLNGLGNSYDSAYTYSDDTKINACR